MEDGRHRQGRFGGEEIPDGVGGGPQHRTKRTSSGAVTISGLPGSGR
jgi:hypothetical protein